MHQLQWRANHSIEGGISTRAYVSAAGLQEGNQGRERCRAMESWGVCLVERGRIFGATLLVELG